MKAMYGLACRVMFLTNGNPNFVAAPGTKSSKIASRNTCLLPLRSDLIISALTCNVKSHIHSLRHAIRFGWLHKPYNQVQGCIIHSLAQSASGSDTARSFDVAGIPVTPSQRFAPSRFNAHAGS